MKTLGLVAYIIAGILSGVYVIWPYLYNMGLGYNTTTIADWCLAIFLTIMMSIFWPFFLPMILLSPILSMKVKDLY